MSLYSQGPVYCDWHLIFDSVCSYFLSGPFVCWGLCLKHFLDELAESQRLRQQQQPWPWAEELGSAGGRASVTGAGTAANAVTSSRLTLGGEPLSHKQNCYIYQMKSFLYCKSISWQWDVTSWHDPGLWIIRWWFTENMRRFTLHASMWLVCGTIEGETLILVCNERLIINKLYRPQRFWFGLDDWHKAVKHSAGWHVLHFCPRAGRTRSFSVYLM